jgi:hypothetical protein
LCTSSSSSSSSSSGHQQLTEKAREEVVGKGKGAEKVEEGWVMEAWERGRVEVVKEVVRERAVVEAEERVEAKGVREGSYRDSHQNGMGASNDVRIALKIHHGHPELS